MPQPLRPRPVVIRVGLPLLAVAALTAGCSSGGTSQAPTAQQPPATSSPSSTPAQTGTTSAPAPSAASVITIENFRYTLPPSVKAGSTVTATNKDSEAHTVTLTGTSVDVTVEGGKSVTFTAPDKAGTYPLKCDFHGNMKSQLTVT